MDPPPPPNAPTNQPAAANWFCHECSWEGAAPLHAPDPTCPRCSGSFIEEIEQDTADDPRDFDAGDDVAFHIEANDEGGHNFRFVLPGGGAAILGGAGGAGLRGGAPRAPQAPPVPGAAGGAPGGPLGALMAAFGWGPNGGQGANAQQNAEDPGDPDEEVAGGDDGQGGAHGGAAGQPQPIRNLADFLASAFAPPQPHPADHRNNNPFAEGGHEGEDDNEQQGGNNAPAPHDPFAAFAAAMNGQQTGGGLNSLVNLLNALGAGPLPGNRGDYAFGENAFQAILEQLAQQAGRAGPNPATKEIIDNLPRRLVDSDFLSSSASQDCVICQETYKLHDTLITLPCKFAHAFHEDCIVPWLKNSGTCPTCRASLVPQPGEDGAPAPTGEEEGAATHGARAGEGESAGQAEGGAPRRNGDGGVMSGGGRTGVLPGSWPSSEAERSRAASRNRERAQREVDEDVMPVLEDLD